MALARGLLALTVVGLGGYGVSRIAHLARVGFAHARQRRQRTPLLTDAANAARAGAGHRGAAGEGGRAAHPLQTAIADLVRGGSVQLSPSQLAIAGMAPPKGVDPSVSRPSLEDVAAALAPRASGARLFVERPQSGDGLDWADTTAVVCEKLARSGVGCVPFVASSDFASEGDLRRALEPLARAGVTEVALEFGDGPEALDVDAVLRSGAVADAGIAVTYLPTLAEGLVPGGSGRNGSDEVVPAPDALAKLLERAQMSQVSALSSMVLDGGAATRWLASVSSAAVDMGVTLPVRVGIPSGGHENVAAAAEAAMLRVPRRIAAAARGDAQAVLGRDPWEAVLLDLSLAACGVTALGACRFGEPLAWRDAADGGAAEESPTAERSSSAGVTVEGVHLVPCSGAWNALWTLRKLREGRFKLMLDSRDGDEMERVRIVIRTPPPDFEEVQLQSLSG